MKGVILGIAPEARVVDLTHEVDAFDMVQGAFTIATMPRSGASRW